MPKPNDYEYIGDGVYVRFDGFQVWLETPQQETHHKIALEPSVWAALVRYMDALEAKKQELSRRCAELDKGPS